MTLNFNSRYAMKYNFSQSWIYNFQKFLGEHPPDHLEGKKKFSSLRLEIFLGARQISHSFLTLKLDRSVIMLSIRIPEQLFSSAHTAESKGLFM